MSKIITCANCNELKPHEAKGLCARCYQNKYQKGSSTKWNHKTGKHKPRLENKNCAPYLGYISELILFNLYLNIQIMPNNNIGYDLIYNNYKIDVKASCRIIRDKHSDRWNFHIEMNKNTDYFACIAFDNRENLNVEHYWLIPGNIVNNQINVGISKTNLNKWNKYRQSNKVINQCNIIRGNLLNG